MSSERLSALGEEPNPELTLEKTAGARPSTLLLGEGRIPRLLLSFSTPAIVGMLAQALYNVIDRVFVGRLDGVWLAVPTADMVSAGLASVLLSREWRRLNVSQPAKTKGERKP